MNKQSERLLDRRLVLVVSFLFVSLAAMFLLEPIPQDPAYHRFADDRSLFGIPNSLDVLSNLPFLVVGVLGLFSLLKADHPAHHHAWRIFFVGVLLVGFGSAYYHLSPDSSTLVWDRLPMTIGFMGLFVALLSEFTGLKPGVMATATAVTVGIGTVVYWAFTDDLRFYAWVQFMPLAVFIILLFGYGSRYTRMGLPGLALLFYVTAKVTEHFDMAVFDALGQIVSGHTLKHLFAAAGCYILLLFLQTRKLLD